MSGESIPEDWYRYTEYEEPQRPIHIDHYWRKIDDLKGAMGERKFPSIMKVVKTGSLILGHGNAEVERVWEASINGIRATTDGLKAFEGPGSVPITRQLLQLVRSVHANYVILLDKEQKEKKEAKKYLTLQKEQTLQMEAQQRQLTKGKEDLLS